VRHAGPSMIYSVRAMKVLLYYDEITITNLAMLSRINHQRCRNLVLSLQSAKYLSTRFEGKRQYVSLTPSGRAFGMRLLDLIAQDSVSPENVLT
jgi:predicted transcriptional regulator